MHALRYSHTSHSPSPTPLPLAYAQLQDFTVDPRRFPLDRFSSFLSSLHAKDQRMVLIVDPAIAVNATYAPYTEGLKEGVFLKGIDGQPYIGERSKSDTSAYV
jgi:alpha-glucosidase (family GH31 glycosyl hydrolase)